MRTTPFYQKALNLFIKTQENQIRKGMKKYPEPFNPHSWTPDQLLNHALEETVDLTHYLVGLKELLDVKDYEIRQLHKEIRRLKSKYEPPVFETKPVRQKSPFETEAIKSAWNKTSKKYDMNFNPHFDQDDQH